MQPTVQPESIHDALREVVTHCQGRASAAVLWPAKPIAQVLMQLGRSCGCHAAMHYTASTAGYSLPTPVDTADELQALQREFIASAAALKQMGQRIEAITAARSSLQAVR